LLTIFVVPTIYTLFARRKIPGEIKEPELIDGASAPSTPVGHGAD